MSWQLETDEYLVRHCAQGGDAEAWGEFLRRYQKVIALSILRIAYQYGGSDRDTVDELVQETLLKLCLNDRAILKGFQPVHAGSVFGFFKVVASNIAHDHFRARLASKRGGRFGVNAELDDDHITAVAALDGVKEVDTHVLVSEVQSKLEELLSGEEYRRDRLIFTLYFRLGMTASAIASLPNVDLSVKGVETALFRIVKLLREQIRAQKQIASHP